jgi:Carboxypeptidase regulatory-like domain
MKSSFFKIGLQFFVFQLGILLCQSVLAAVNFTVTPSAISNTYSGPITLQVTGLTSGDTVVVQKFLDANANGVVDATDLLFQQFQLTDGSASVFHDGATAVTNVNVPGDMDGSANGQIMAQLYSGSDFAQLIVGKYLFVLSSPVGHFSPITQSFSVTNFPFAQTISGNVVSNTTPVPNAIVILFQPSGDGENPVGGVVANNSGNYNIKTPTGTYLLWATKTNFVANLATSPNITLDAGATITTNLFLTHATQSISGKVVDANNASIGLAGYLLPVQSSDGLLAIAFTDTNGNFTARVVPDQWKISQNEQSLAYKGYLAFQNNLHVDTTTGSVSGVTIALPKATAIFYGNVKDNLENPLAGVHIYASDQSQYLYETEAYTDTNGNYIAGALAESWQIDVDNDQPASLANYIFSDGTQTTLSSGQAYPYSFTGVLATNQITGNVQFNGSPVSGVQVYALALINTTYYQSQADTDANGNYSLNVANGNWNVNVYDCNGCGDSDSLSTVLDGQNYQDPASQNTTIANNSQTVNFTIEPPGAEQIYGYVMDTGGNPVVGVNVYANDGAGDNYSTTTDGAGYYSFNVGNGNWDVSVDCGGLNSLGYQCVNDDYVDVSGNSVEADFTVQSSNLPLQVTTTSLPNGNVGAAYSTQLGASGGQPPYNWSLATGSQPLPPGLNILNYSPAPGSSIGSVAGTPTANGLFPFIVQVTDANSKSVTQPLGLIINPKPSLGSAAKSSGTHFQFLLNAASNQNYTIQVSTDLSSTNWTTLVVTNNTTANSYLIVDPNATNKQRFYRAVIGP